MAVENMNNNFTESQNHVYFVNTEDPPLKVKHICYFTKQDGEKLKLCEVVEEYHPHPDVPSDILIPCYNIYDRDTRKLFSNDSGPLVQSWAMENTLGMIYPITNVNKLKCH